MATPPFGAFTAAANAVVNQNITAATRGIDYYVDPQNGTNYNSGLSAGSPFADMNAVFAKCQPGVRIGLLGVLKQEWIGPLINDVTIVGLGNQPRQATTSGVANGGGATWLSPATVTNTAALLRVRGQGWKIQNIFFNNTATSNGCVQVYTTGDPPIDSDGAHAQFLGCRFTGAAYGIYASGGTNFVTVDGCTFFNFTGTGDTGIAQTAGAGIGTLLGWVIQNCDFFNNVNHVVMPLSRGIVRNCNFNVVGQSLTTTIALSLTGGAGNSIYNNMFNRPTNTSPNATLFVGGTGDVWSQNFGSDAIFFGVPDNS